MNPVGWLQKKLDNFSETHLSKWDVLYVPVGAFVIFVVGLFFWLGLAPWLQRPSPGVQVAIASADAAFMVGWFAIVSSWHARRQANISNRALEVALDAQRNASIPVIAMRYEPQGPTDKIAVWFRNVGPGPALRFQCWLESNDLKVNKERFNFPGFGPGEEHPAYWPKEHFGQDTAGVSLDVVTQYDDIFGQTFESRWHLAVPTSFSFRKLVGNGADVRRW